jgi:hypothetical protein
MRSPHSEAPPPSSSALGDGAIVAGTSDNASLLTLDRSSRQRVATLRPKAKPSKRHWYAYDVLFEGEVIVSDDRDPETSLARGLFARGITGFVEIVEDKSGKPRSTINVEKAAKLRTSEEDRDGLRFRRYVEDPDSSPYTAEEKVTGSQVERAAP